MSANKEYTVQSMVEYLYTLPPDMLVVGFGIDGSELGELIDGISAPWIATVREGRDGFIPLTKEQQSDYKDAGLSQQVLMISPIEDQESLVEWCFDGEE